MAAANEPVKLLLPYLQRADELQKHEYLVAYYSSKGREMSTLQQGSSGVCRRGKNVTASRRTWSQREEEVLIAAIRELISQGFKSENGFRAGYLGRLEEAMRKVFPSSDLKGTPHINSKISSWKKSFYSLCGILSRSGVGFNTKGNFMLEVEDDTWESIVQVDPAAKGMRYRQWPYYEIWLEIFGRDRATGDAAEDLVDAGTAAVNEANSEQAHGGEAYAVGAEDTPLDTDAETSINGQCSKIAGASTSTREKKRKVSREIQEVIAVLDRIGHSADVRLDNLAAKFGYEFALDVKKREAFEKLHKMEFLTMPQRFKVCELLAKEADKLQVFRNLADEHLPAYVEHLLGYVTY